jgi:hypothetical protein
VNFSTKSFVPEEIRLGNPAPRLVGPSGEVVAVERDARSINRAQTRAAEAGLHNVTSAQTDIAQFSSGALAALVCRCFVAPRSLSTLQREYGDGARSFQDFPQSSAE